MSASVHPLRGNQARAVDPADSVWLSASAGTGKTQVLSARVLRLLLRPEVHPEQILCLTFTKAGAAEMAARVSDVLAGWVRKRPEELAADLIAIGADHSPLVQARARSLFASVLDCPGGGLRIDTIHAFSQWLLANFPEEAGLVPGTQPMEDRDRELLAHRVLAELLVGWEEQGDDAMIAALEMLSERLGPDKARAWLMRCAGARAAWFGPGAWQEPLRNRVEHLLGLEADAGPESVAALCADDVFDVAALHGLRQILAAWDTKTGRSGVEAIDHWLALGPERATELESLLGPVINKDGAPSAVVAKRDPAYAGLAERLWRSIRAVLEQRQLIELVGLLTPALSVGRRFALAWDEAKKREGLVDFDDLIRSAAQLLAQPGLGEWIRYKLDRRFDHILIDEAQDTNEAQWSIIDALTDDFFAGLGQRDDRLRTIFVVGDYKQAIFRFQGTSPENFARARARFAQAMAERATNARLLRERIDARELQQLGLGQSFRTAQGVLDFVDRAIAAIGPASFGLREEPEPHSGEDRPGLVTVWDPVGAQDDDEDPDGEGAEGWLSEPERRMADRIARQVQLWLRQGYPLVKGGQRNATAGDIMVLVRKRRDLAGLIVARLHARGVPVAGVDRLRLGAPLAVKDLLAALRFAAQPLDDLSLASVLVSPLLGWNQDQLLEHGYREKGVALWDHLRRSEHADAVRAVAMLRDLLALADYETPQALLHWILLGPWRGRHRLVARLGHEAEDPIDELLNTAFAFSSAYTPSLQGFIRWFDAGEGELKREPGSNPDLVRVMTVHGSKGLQAPIVILADATGNPDVSPVRGLELEEQLPGGGGRVLPLPDLRKQEKVGRIAAAEERAKREEREEHWRLLYVAMTRAEEALFVGGALAKREKEPADDSWYARLSGLLDGEGAPDAIWGGRREWGEMPPPVARAVRRQMEETGALPPWAHAPIGPEPRPPRPLAPSVVGEDQAADPPLPPEVAALAARRGVLMHRLLERLPQIAGADRTVLGARWLQRNAADLAEADRAEMLAACMAVIAEPQWADLFSTAALAEVPLAVTVEGQVIAGTADRLLVQPGRVLVADFKTARRPPRRLEDVPEQTLRQMSAYVAALAQIYPGSRIEAAVLYTQTPQLFVLPEELLARHKPRLAPLQESFVP